MTYERLLRHAELMKAYAACRTLPNAYERGRWKQAFADLLADWHRAMGRLSPDTRSRLWRDLTRDAKGLPVEMRPEDESE